MSNDDLEREIFFKCPRCSSLFSTTRRILEQDKFAKVPVTRLILGGRLAPAAYTPKCTQCGKKLERITAGEFQENMSKSSATSRQE